MGHVKYFILAATVYASHEKNSKNKNNPQITLNTHRIKVAENAEMVRSIMNYN
jgi:hypothetical protein